MFITKMLLRIVYTAFLLNISMLICEGANAALDENSADLTFKNDNRTEMNQFPNSCAELSALNRQSGIHEILISGYSPHPFSVSCDEETQGGGWTTVMRRQDGSVDFFLFWEDYKNGFGNLTGEFFIGLEKLHFMTKRINQELLIIMDDFKGEQRYAKYARFAIGGEMKDYKIIALGKYSGDAGDDLRYHAGQKFSTRDRDNDQSKRGNCAERFTGAWWYNHCHNSNLMGSYNDNNYGKGVNWKTFSTYIGSLKRVEMKIRLRKVSN